MKLLLSFLLLLVSGTAGAYQCEDYTSDRKELKTLNFIATKVYKYPNLSAFCNKDRHVDLQLSFMPNYFKTNEENDDHYRLMVHYPYSSCTFIYNFTRNKLSYKQCYSTW